MKLGIFTVALAVLISSRLPAPASAGDLRLQWNWCGDGGSSLEEFACNTNFAGHALIPSFVSPIALDALIRAEAEILVDFPGAAGVPAWWNLAPGSECRSAPLLARRASFAELQYCEDRYFDVGTFAVLSYEISSGAPDRLRLVVTATIQASQARRLDAGVPIAICMVYFGNGGTVAAGPCAGCDVPAGLHLERVTLTQAPGASPQTLTLTRDGEGMVAGWQCPYVLASPEPVLACETRLRRSSWSTIKLLYR